MKSIGTLLLFCSMLTLIETIRFTNLKCGELDPNFATFEKCILKVVQRGVISLNIHVKLLRIPVTNATVNFSMHKKLSGYRPFLYNYTVDFCQFQTNRKRYPVMKLFFDSVLEDSNINHTCPFSHDLIVDNLILKESMFEYLPLPLGEYMLQIKVAAYKDWKADVKVYLDINRDL